MSSSKRQKRQSIRQGAHSLRKKAGWDPHNFERPDPLEALRKLDQQERTDATFASAAACPDCAEAAATSGQEDALCQTHLAEAMGF